MQCLICFPPRTLYRRPQKRDNLRPFGRDSLYPEFAEVSKLRELLNEKPESEACCLRGLELSRPSSSRLGRPARQLSSGFYLLHLGMACPVVARFWGRPATLGPRV